MYLLSKPWYQLAQHIVLLKDVQLTLLSIILIVVSPRYYSHVLQFIVELVLCVLSIHLRLLCSSFRLPLSLLVDLLAHAHIDFS